MRLNSGTMILTPNYLGRAASCTSASSTLPPMYNGDCTYIGSKSLTEQTTRWAENGADFTYYKAVHDELNTREVTSADTGASEGNYYFLIGKGFDEISVAWLCMHLTRRALFTAYSKPANLWVTERFYIESYDDEITDFVAFPTPVPTAPGQYDSLCENGYYLNNSEAYSESGATPKCIGCPAGTARKNFNQQPLKNVTSCQECAAGRASLGANRSECYYAPLGYSTEGKTGQSAFQDCSDNFGNFKAQCLAFLRY